MTSMTSYYLWGGLGFVIAAPIAFRNAMKNGLSFPFAVILLTISLYGGLLGTRVFYVYIYNPSLFSTNLPLALAFWKGNLSWQGGPIGGFLSCALTLAICRKPILSNMGAFAPGLALAHGIARLTCVFQGCCYGSPTTVPWAIQSKHLNAMVHPTPVYSMTGEIISFFILQWMFQDPKKRKYLVPMYCANLSIHRFISEGFRGTPPGIEIFDGLRYYQGVSIIMLVASLAMLLIIWRPKIGTLYATCLVLATTGVWGLMRPTPEPMLMEARNDAAIYLVLTRDDFTDGLKPWIEHREQQGYNVAVGHWPSAPSAEKMKQWISQTVTKTCSYILIVGDCDGQEGSGASWHMPSHNGSSTSVGSSKPFITDTLFGDLDGDSVPDVPVGRFPVRNMAQLRTQITKTIAFDNEPVTADWFKTTLWTGAEAYNREMEFVRDQLSRQLPDWLDVMMISGYEQSAYSGILSDQCDVFLESICQPSLLSVIVTHGSYRSVTPTAHEGKPVFLSVEHAQAFHSDIPLAPMFILACDSGTFNLKSPDNISLAEAFLNNSGGPSAVVAATLAIHPLTNYYVARFMNEKLAESPETIGNYLLSVQRELQTLGKQSFIELSGFDDVAKQFISSLGKDKICETRGILSEQVLSYNLLGDPALKFSLPNKMTCNLDVDEEGAITITGIALDGAKNVTIAKMPAVQNDGLMDASVTDEIRLQRFSELNRPAIHIATTRITTSELKVTLEPKTALTKGDTLRIIAYGSKNAAVAVIKVP